MWEEHGSEEAWGFLLVDACNAFNKGNIIVMLWTVSYEWSSDTVHI
jgi:hypothetical protein